jgi:Flp pilus assembly protein TadG
VLTDRVRGHVLAFARTSEGVSAVEFSLIAPILLMMFMAAVELPRAYMIGRRLDIAAAAMADLISKDTYADLTPVYAATAVIGNPYNVDAAAIVLTAAGTYQTGAATTTQVCSSAAQNGQARQVGSSLGPPPAGMTAGGDRFVVSDVTMPYRPVFAVFPSLLTYTFHFRKVWPVRGGETYRGQKEVVLPNGKPCPA